MKTQETILKIEEVTFEDKDGFIITTTEQEIKLGINNRQQCFEDWGYFMSEDNLTDFIGAKLLDIKITDTLLKPIKGFNEDDMYNGGVMFVNVETSDGLLQFIAYNEHNGYYGHSACVISKQVTDDDIYL